MFSYPRYLSCFPPRNCMVLFPTFHTGFQVGCFNCGKIASITTKIHVYSFGTAGSLKTPNLGYISYLYRLKLLPCSWSSRVLLFVSNTRTQTTSNLKVEISTFIFRREASARSELSEKIISVRLKLSLELA